MTMTKDPAAILDYVWDWTGWLADGETITAHTITPTGVTLVNSTVQDGKRVVARISGGTIGGSGTGSGSAVCHITTSTGQQDERTMRFTITDR